MGFSHKNSTQRGFKSNFLDQHLQSVAGILDTVCSPSLDLATGCLNWAASLHVQFAKRSLTLVFLDGAAGQFRSIACWPGASSSLSCRIPIPSPPPLCNRDSSLVPMWAFSLTLPAIRLRLSGHCSVGWDGLGCGCDCWTWANTTHTHTLPCSVSG